MTSGGIGRDIDHAIRVLREGGVVALPTETVYGLGADAVNRSAVARVFRIKGRPVDHPLIVHVVDTDSARACASDWTPEAEVLARSFWPGPLTIIVERSSSMIDEVTGFRSTVALRCPSHPMMRRVLEAFPLGIAAPSANRFGKVSPTTAQHVLDDLAEDVDYILDGGPCDIGVESTIVDCSVHPAQLLRPGGVPTEEISRVLGSLASTSGPSRAPGMLESHYVPNCRVHPVATRQRALDEIESGLRSRSARDGDGSSAPEILDASIDPDSFAATMYAQLRECARRGVQDVYVILPEDVGIGAAIRDRILKAAAQH